MATKKRVAKKKATKKKPRRGRPPVDNPANIAIKAYVTQDMRDAVEDRADRDGDTISVVVRKALEQYVS